MIFCLLLFFNHYLYSPREFELRLPRQEVEEVDSLREKWAALMELAEQVREVLLKERRGAFEQELDKQVKVRMYRVLVKSMKWSFHLTLVELSGQRLKFDIIKILSMIVKSKPYKEKLMSIHY